MTHKKLNPSSISEIRHLSELGASRNALADLFGVSYMTIVYTLDPGLKKQHREKEKKDAEKNRLRVQRHRENKKQEVQK